MVSGAKPLHFPIELNKTTEVVPKAPEFCHEFPVLETRDSYAAALPAYKMNAVMAVSFRLSSLETFSVCFCRLENLVKNC